MRRRGWGHWLYLAPALFALGVFLVYPTINTIYLSFLDRRSEEFVGFDNYEKAFTKKPFLIAFRNNAIWLVVFTSVTVSLGLVLAVLLDRVRYEVVAKSIIFLPMAISFVGAGVIWKFVYAFRPPGTAQIGFLNGIRNGLGFEPIAWLIERPWINNLALVVVGIWVWTGFSMVILSAAYKGIPKDMLEAARIDGANEFQVFFHVTIPFLKSTLAVVTTTMIVFVLKVFDIVFVMTNGNFDTDVVANRMIKEMFQFRNMGMASAIAVILLLATLPAVVVNIRRFRAQEAVR
ncbi:MAG: carbohydrate ABC transporter permease [Candidatus Bipolaricaulia bacterium]